MLSKGTAGRDEFRRRLYDGAHVGNVDTALGIPPVGMQKIVLRVDDDEMDP
mgnify:CR=1 FL=1